MPYGLDFLVKGFSQLCLSIGSDSFLLKYLKGELVVGELSV